MSTKSDTDKELDSSEILRAQKEGKRLAERILKKLGTIKPGTYREPHEPSNESFLFFVDKSKQKQSSKKSKDEPTK